MLLASWRLTGALPPRPEWCIDIAFLRSGWPASTRSKAAPAVSQGGSCEAKDACKAACAGDASLLPRVGLGLQSRQDKAAEDHVDEGGRDHFVRFCARHRPASLNFTGFSSGVGSMCQAEGCGKHANFGARGDKAQYCRRHKHPAHVNVKYAVCKMPGCSSSARYKMANSSSAEWCARHKSNQHAHTSAHPRCSHKGCQKMAYFIHPADTLKDQGTVATATGAESSSEAAVSTARSAARSADSAAMCARHRLAGQVDFRNKKCRQAGCSKQPIFGPEGGSPQTCRQHSADGFVDLKNRRCAAPQCGRRATIASAATSVSRGGSMAGAPKTKLRRGPLMWCKLHSRDGGA